MTNEEIFESKAYFNKWLKELTKDEELLIIDMLEEAREDGANFTKKYWQEKNRWIPVTERLPEFEKGDPSSRKKYLVKVIIGSISPKTSYAVAYLIRDDKWSCEGDWIVATHWREIE